MKLIIIYGSAATGKLTVARQLAQKTEYRLFHNHISFDVAKALFAHRSERFNELIWDVRDLVFEHAARSDIPGLIFTWAYSHPDFQPYLDRIQAIIDRYHGEIHLVYLSCALEELKRRVVQQDRQQAGKLNTVAGLEKERTLKNHQVIPNSGSLEIDNTDLSPRDTANRIIAHFEL